MCALCTSQLLLDYLRLQAERGEPRTHIDVYGGGEELPSIRAEAEALGLDLAFYPPTDHAGGAIRPYKVFVNPSQSEVLSTTTAEALAMGKYVVLQRHASNTFFAPFANALFYETPSEFLLQLRYALHTTPAPLTQAERRALSWEGATERFLDAITNSTLGDTLPSLGDHSARWVHQGMQRGGSFGDAMRKMSGGGPIAVQSWLSSPQYRDAGVQDIVEQSLARSPPVGALPQDSHRRADVRDGTPPQHTDSGKR